MPVVVGVGQVVQPEEADAISLMVEAARAAATDAGAPDLLKRVGTVLVPEGMWRQPDALTRVSDAIGAPDARTVLARVGILQTTVLARAAADIAAGRVEVALVVGGEAKARSAPAGTEASGPAPDEVLEPDGEIVTAVEIERGLALPVRSYALQEEALRHHRGESTAEHAARLARLGAAASAVAARNPFAWDRQAHMEAAIADPAAPGNRMVARPYTKRHCSQWNVNQAAAILLVAAEVADELGISDDRRVYPVAIVDSNAMIPVSRRAELYRSPGFAVAGERLAQLSSVEPARVDHLDLYSCFPSAVQIQATELGIDLDGPVTPTVTGGMAFAGGPLNSYVLHAVASMVDTLRRQRGTGLVTAVSGMITKQGVSLWSTAPPRDGFRRADVAEETLAATATREVDASYRGEAVVDGSTVAFDRDGPATAIVVATTTDGRRVVAQTDDRALAESFVDAPRTGEPVRVDGPKLLR